METIADSSAAVWPATRSAALERLARFVPRAGRAYAATRNDDRGPADRSNVSTLSPYLRCRLITEAEVLASVLARHTAAAAEKFISEVFWRTYWNGWLTAHPQAWSRYVATRDAAFARVAAEPQLRAAYDRAVSGRTGIDAFDAWAAELAAGNYLHNHARMWFASMWTFTLGLPWELGADLFMQRLLDGDPASNTLSWRWVAGLHTRGKTYAAMPDNIRRYTGGRFTVTAPLARSPRALADAPLARQPLPELTRGPAIREPALLVIHDGDLHADAGELPADLRGVCALTAVAQRSPRGVAPAVAAFNDAAADDARAAIGAATGATDLGRFAGAAPGAALAQYVAEAARACGARTVVAAFSPPGPVRDLLPAAEAGAAAAGCAYREIGRAYDSAAWPAATGGFFGLRKRIPAILAELGLGAG